MRGRLAVAGLAVVLTGCAGAEVVHTPATIGRPAKAAATVGTQPAKTPTTPPVAPASHDGPCPYLGVQFVMDTVGQHVTRTAVAATTPPTCTFYRPDGSRAAQVAGSRLGSAAAALAKARAIAGAGANPVTDVADGGAVALTAGGTTLAAAKGDVLLVVRINQQSSLEAAELASEAFRHL